MSQNPFPSPNPSSASSRLPDVLENLSEPSESYVDRNVATEAEDSEAAFQQASERIRYLRREIVQLRRQELQLEHTRNGLNPGHEAIVLTGQQDRAAAYLDDMERMRTIIPSDTRERLREFEARRLDGSSERARSRMDRTYSQLLRAAAAHMHPLDTSVSPSSSHPSAAQSPLSFASPRSPPRQRLLPHRSLLDSAVQPLRRRETSDDPHTEIGRRVAARESARTAAHNSPQNSLPSSRDSPRRLPTVIERDFEYNGRTRPRRSEPGLLRRLEQPSSDYIHEAQSRISRSLDNAGILQSSNSMEPQLLRRIRTSQSRQGSNPSINLPSATSSQSRLSLLSNLAMQNLPTPSSTISNPPLLFEEPTGYDGRALYNEREDHVRAILEARLHISQARMDWEDRADEDLLFTSSPVQMHHEADITRAGHHRDNTVQMQAPSRPSLLDANGDEIQSDTARQLANSLLGLYSFAPAAPRHRQETHEIPSTLSNSISSPVHDRPSTQDLRSVCREPSQQTFGTGIPRYIDPLPSAIVDKFIALGSQSQPTHSRRPDLRISTTTSVNMVRAGR